MKLGAVTGGIDTQCRSNGHQSNDDQSQPADANEGAVTTLPAADPSCQRLAYSEGGLVRQPALDVAGQREC